MRFLVGLLIAACGLGHAASTEVSRLATASSITSSIPSCSLLCMATIVPEICGSLTNTTCICTDSTLNAQLGACVLGACNVTETFRLQKYQADSCGVANDESRYKEQLHTFYALPALATLFVGIRIFARLKMETMGADDWTMIAAWFAYMGDVGAAILMLSYKFGWHSYELSPHQMEESLKYFYVCELFYIVVITLTKISLLLFFIRIFPQQTFRRIVYVVMVYTAISSFAVLMALTFQCVPFYGNWTNWEYKVPPVKCIDTYAAVYFGASNSIFQDLIIIVLPIPTLWSLNLRWQKKLTLLFMFSVGFFVILCSALRLPSLIKLKTSTDPSWDQAPISIWTDLEIAVGIICGCLPATRSLLGHLFPYFSMKLTTSYNKNSGSGPDYTPKARSRFPSGGKKDRDDSFMELTNRGDLETVSQPDSGHHVSEKERPNSKILEFNSISSSKRDDSNEFEPISPGTRIPISPGTRIPISPGNGVGVSSRVFADGQSPARDVFGNLGNMEGGIVLTREVDQISDRSVSSGSF